MSAFFSGLALGITSTLHSRHTLGKSWPTQLGFPGFCGFHLFLRERKNKKLGGVGRLERIWEELEEENEYNQNVLCEIFKRK